MVAVLDRIAHQVEHQFAVIQLDAVVILIHPCDVIIESVFNDTGEQITAAQFVEIPDGELASEWEATGRIRVMGNRRECLSGYEGFTLRQVGGFSASTAFCRLRCARALSIFLGGQQPVQPCLGNLAESAVRELAQVFEPVFRAPCGLDPVPVRCLLLNLAIQLFLGQLLCCVRKDENIAFQ